MTHDKRSRKRKLNEKNDDTVSSPLTDSLSSAKCLAESAFHLLLPADYMQFYQFCCQVNSRDPLGAIEAVTQLRLVGPFEILHKPPHSVNTGQFIQCNRYFHDPPEFVTLLIGPGYLHFGCFRDLPSDYPLAIVGFDPPDCGKMKIYARNLFSFLNPNSDKARDLLDKLDSFANQHQIALNDTTTAITKHRSKFVCPTLNSMGLFIELKEDDVGYRPLTVTYDKLSAMLQAVVSADERNRLSKFEPIDELITYAQFACDEGDYGQSLELGLSMLSFKPKGLPNQKAEVLNSRIKHLLSVGYTLAGRPEFAKVIEGHMEDRRVEPLRLPNTD